MASGQRDKPMPNISFRVMAFLLDVYHRFIVPVDKELAKTGIEEGQTVLDFGCGPKDYTVHAATIVGPGGRVFALDIHPLAIKAVERKANEMGLANIRTILSDRDTGLPDESVDVILLFDMIHMVADKPALLKKLHRVLKPDSLLSVWVHHMKVEEVVKTAQQDGLFALRERSGKILNFNRSVAS